MPQFVRMQGIHSFIERLREQRMHGRMIQFFLTLSIRRRGYSDLGYPLLFVSS